MRKYFNTEEKALAHLKYRKDCAYKRIKKRGDVVLADNSFVYQNYLWKQYDNYAVETKIKKWFVSLMIYTQNMYDDIKKFKPFDYDKYKDL